MNAAPQVEKTVGEWVVERPSRARVFERLGIDYCCGGKHPLRQACVKKSLDYEVVLAELERDGAAPEEGARNWASASLTDLCDHIEQTHHAYLKQELPRLEFLTTKVAARHGDTRPALRQVHQVFVTLKSEMEGHMMKEERVLFPYILRLAEIAESGDAIGGSPFGTVENPIRMMEYEHETVGSALKTLRRLTSDHTAPADGCNTFRGLYHGFAELERELMEHIHLENNVLHPRAVEMEKGMLATA